MLLPRLRPRPPPPPPPVAPIAALFVMSLPPPEACPIIGDGSSGISYGRDHGESFRILRTSSSFHSSAFFCFHGSPASAAVANASAASPTTRTHLRMIASHAVVGAAIVCAPGAHRNLRMMSPMYQIASCAAMTFITQDTALAVGRWNKSNWHLALSIWLRRFAPPESFSPIRAHPRKSAALSFQISDFKFQREDKALSNLKSEI